MKKIFSLLLVSALSMSVLTCGKKTPNSQSRIQNVFGKDDRVKLTSTEYPWRSIVRIDAHKDFGDMWCTGVLVSPDLVLTSKKCIYSRPEELRVSPFYVNGQGPYSVTGHTVGYSREDEQSDDWAFMQLNIPLGNTLGYMAIKNLPAETLISMGNVFVAVGYTADFESGNSAGIHSGCSVMAEIEKRLATDCDFNVQNGSGSYKKGGTFGGPLFASLDGVPSVVGVMTQSPNQVSGAGGPYQTNEATMATKVNEEMLESYKYLMENPDTDTPENFISLCNHSSSEVVSAALARRLDGDIWQTSGWISVPQNQCINRGVGASGEVSELRVFGKDFESGLTWGGGDLSLCIKSKGPFLVKSTPDECLSDKGFEYVNFGSLLQLQPSKANVWTFN